MDIDEAGDALLLAGEIDSFTAPVLAERLAESGAVTVVDLSGVTFLDSSGLRVLVEAHRVRAETGGSLRLRAPSTNVQHLLEISGLLDHFDVVD